MNAGSPADRVATFHYLRDGSENARRCERSKRWGVDVDQPGRLDAVECGSVIGDRFLREPCRVHLTQVGELPDPMTGRHPRPRGD